MKREVLNRRQLPAKRLGETAMHPLRLGRSAMVSGLWLLAACSGGSSRVPGSKTQGATESGNIPISQVGASCKSNSECPPGQRCGFTGAMGCQGSGTCVVESVGGGCFDPGGRCGCDGQTVDLFCAKGSSSEFASAPVAFVGPCPIPCTEDRACPSRLICENGVCRQPQHEGRKIEPRKK
jgi:hypothetical protein